MGHHETFPREPAWAAWRKGDLEGKNEFCNRVFPQMFRYARSLRLSEQDSEEVVQEVLLTDRKSVV